MQSEAYFLRWVMMAAAIVAGLLTADAGAVVIDDFESGGPVSLTTATTGETRDVHEEFGLPTLFGNRRIESRGANGQATTVSLDTGPGDDALSIVQPGPDPTVGWPTRILYGTDDEDAPTFQEIDVTSMGDRFYFKLSQDPGDTARLGYSYRSDGIDGGGLVQVMNGSGYYELEWSFFHEVAFDQLQEVGILIQTDEGTQTIEVTEFGIVPEPTTALLLIGAAPILLTRRDRRKRNIG